MSIRELFRRDIGRRVANEGVAKVWDENVLLEEMRDYVVTEEIARHLRAVISAFLDSMDMRDSASAREGMAVWVSGFFGSGKSHFAKMVGHLLANTLVDPDGGNRALDVLAPHIDGTSQAAPLAADFHRLRTQVWVHPILIEIKSKEDLTNPNSIAEICLSSFYESLGYSPTVYVAHIEQTLADRGVYEEFKSYYEDEFGEPWIAGRKKHMFNRTRIAKALAHCLPSDYPDEDAAKQGIEDARQDEAITAESFAEELLQYLEARQAELSSEQAHIVFVLDEMQQFIGEDNRKIEELRAIVEQLGARGKGRVWVICTGQEALDKVVDRAGLNLAALGKLGARFSIRIDLRSEDVSKVTCELLLKKAEAALPQLTELYGSNDGFYAECSNLGTERTLPRLNEESFIASYPFLPYQMPLAQHIFDTMRGTRLSGNERSMLAVTQPILKRLADEPLGALVPFDWVFDEIEAELCSDDHLGTHGVRSIREADQSLESWTVSPSRCLKVLWLAQRLNWVPRTADTLARLLVDETGTDLAELQDEVEYTLERLREARYVALEEAGDQYKFLSPEEGEVEKALQDKQAGYGVGVVLRRAKEITKERVLTRQRLGELRILHGKSRAPIDYGLSIDGEVVKAGGEIAVEAYEPRSTAKVEELEKKNLAAGDKGNVIWWIARGDHELETRLKRLEALRWLTTDPRHTTGRSPKYFEAVEEKRREAEELEQHIAEEMAESFRAGRLLYAGETVELDGDADLRTVISSAVEEVVPNLYTRFHPADVEYDAEDIDHLVDPTVRDLKSVCSALGLFDSSGQLLASAPLMEPLLEELQRREDEDDDLTGDAILGHFGAIPFGWPNDLVRLVTAAAVRGGAVAVVTGGKRHFDCTEPGVAKCLTGIREFKKAQFVVVEEVVPPGEIAEAKRILVELGVERVTESANEQAKAVRQVAGQFAALAQRAATAETYGIPLPETYKRVTTLCEPLVEEDDPTKVVRALLEGKEEWLEVKEFFDELDTFLDEGRDKTYLSYQGLIGACRDNPVLLGCDQAEAARTALAEIDAIAGAREVISKWGTYRQSAEELLGAYRAVYRDMYESVTQGTQDLQGEVEAMPEWSELEPERQQAIHDRFFGPSGPLGVAISVDLTTLSELLAATARYPLSALDAVRVALPAHRQEVARAVREGLAKQTEESGATPPRVHYWRPAEELRGKRFGSKEELHDTLAEIESELGDKLDDDYTIIVE